MAKNALVVDDSVTVRKMVSEALKEIGFAVTTASDGAEAAKYNEKSKFDIVITDTNIPHMDGIALITHLRGTANGKNIPILVLTTESNDEIKNAGKTAGASGWIVKPFNPEAFKNAVNKLCG